VLDEQKRNGVQRRLVPFKMIGASPPPRAHYPIYKEARKIAETTSGTLSPTLKAGIGMAYVPTELARIGEEFELEIRERRYPMRIEKKPLHQPGVQPELTPAIAQV
jgi:aminomethyltransferase